MPAKVVLGAAVACLVGACAPGESGSEAPFQIRDSADVEIVESMRPAWEEGEAWRVGSGPLLRIGVVEGEAAYQFTGVAGAVRLADGRVVVADGGAQEVRFFGPDGVHFRTVGRPGGGPGEFTGLSGLGKDGSGRIWAYDFSLRRITWMDEAGEITRFTSLGMEPAMLNPVGALPDGTFLLKQLWGAEQTSEASTTGLRRDPIAIVRFGVDGVLVDTLGLFPGREVYLTDEGGRGVMNTPPFARNASATLRGGRVVVGPQIHFELREMSPEGRVLRVVRVLGKEEAVGPEELERYIQLRLQAAPPERHAEMRRSLESMPVPETMPPYGGILGDEDGNLWVGEWAMYPQVAGSWDVFDPAGAWLGAVGTPPKFDPRDIGSDWVLGVERDELDVEYVVVYPLLKGEGVRM
jgi:sugar lactone lactonase YvrE